MIKYFYVWKLMHFLMRCEMRCEVHKLKKKKKESANACKSRVIK